MPVRLRITILFVTLVIIILGMICSGIYYFSYTSRIDAIETRLTNRAITTARLLAQKEAFDRELVQRIDSLTTIALKNKTVQAYNYQNNKIYSYSDVPGDTLQIDQEFLDDARVNNAKFFTIDDKEAVAYHYADNNNRIVVVSAAEDIEGKKGLYTLYKILLFSFLTGVGLVLITGYIFSGRLLLPIKRITADVEDISAQNLARRIHTGSTKDEWYRFANTLNDLLNRLQTSFDLQRRFISNASHELSTPLTSISSQLEVSLQRKREADEYRKVMESIYQDVQHMNKLTQTLLEFAKAAGNAGGLEIDLVRMDEILLRLPAEMVKIDPANKVLLQFGDLPEDQDKLFVFGNETLLFTAIKNIVINACKYSEEQKANVSLKTLENRVLVVISNKGNSIPEAELEHIFQPFYRVENNMPRRGFGLGLSLADRIIKLHKGNIQVASDPAAETSFTISLPAAASAGRI
ncbi:MAG: HAMP domain-containing sensor histidine kinase [Chitinophagaceae bacterium]